MEKIVNQVGRLALGLASGEPLRGAVAVADAAAFALGQLQASGKSPEAVFERVAAAHHNARARELSGADGREVAAVEALLIASPDRIFDRAMLVKAAFDPRGMVPAATEAVVADLGITAAQGYPDSARHYAAELVAAGLEAAQEALYGVVEAGLAVEGARQTAAMHAKLDRIEASVRSAVPPELLENLAWRFEYSMPVAPGAELAEFLKAKAAEWKGMKSRLAALEQADARLADARAAAEAAVARADFDEAEATLAGVEALQQEHRTLAEVRRQAEIRQARADTLMLKGDADGAAAHFEAAAGFLLPFAPTEAASIRHAAADRLFANGARAGGTGLPRAIDLYRRNEEVWTRAKHPLDWATTQNSLGDALRTAAWLITGVSVLVPPWGTTKNDAARALLGEAVAAFRAAQEVRSRAAPAVDWATTETNLGAAFADLARLTGGRVERAVVLERAVAAHRAALEVLSPQEHPVVWAAAQNGLGIALADLADRTVGARRVPMFRDALAALQAASAASPDADQANRARIQVNLALVLERLGDQGDGEAVERYTAASTCLEAAHEVFDLAGMEVDDSLCNIHRARLAEKLAPQSD